ncbi:MAG: hypothetical protein K2X27_20105 [Candidatus Obscuribacterales bacterium]|nr:hypothetical protein [Candidatus Obscuribacterales bacterium]
MKEQGIAVETLKNETRLRSKKANAACELPICLLVVILLIGFPFIDLLFISARFALLSYACAEAARAAAAAPSFVANEDDSLSAVNKSNEVLKKYLENFSGIEIISNSTEVLSCPLKPGEAYSLRSSPFSPSELRQDVVYQYRVTSEAKLEPLINFNGVLFGSIQGLTEPLRVSCVSQRVCEKPETLVK